MPLVSLVMSVYNGEKFLRESVESILSQTFKDFEFIIINDGSKDQTKIILNEYESLDTRIILVNQKNEGLTKSLARGCKLAKGEYIARQDVDDISMPKRIERQVDFLLAHQNTVLVGTWYETHNNTTGVVLHTPINNDIKLRKNLYNHNPFCHSSVMFRKDAYNFTSGYNLAYQTSQDLDLWLKLAQIGKIGMIEENLVLRRIHNGAISNSIKAWQQVKNSFLIRVSNLNKKNNNYFYIVNICFATVYHVTITFLPDSISSKLSRMVNHLKIIKS